MTDTNRAEPMKGLAFSIETVIDAADGGKLYQVRCIADHSAFTICPPRKDRLEAVSLRRAFEDALRSVIAAEVEASRLPLAGEAPSDEEEHSGILSLMGKCKCPRCGLPQAECDFQKNFPDPEPFDCASPAPSDAAVQPVAWLHEVYEPEHGEHSLLSRSPESPWAHWLDTYKAKCKFKTTPLYPSPLPTALEWKLRQEQTRMLNMELDLIRVAHGEATLCDFPEVESLRAALAAAPLDRSDTARLDWLFANCRIVFHPPSTSGGTYPIEHNPHALGYGNKRDSTPILQFADAAIEALAQGEAKGGNHG